MTRLVIVTGSSGALGQAYVTHFSRQANTQCVSVSRSPVTKQLPSTIHVQADLLNRRQVEQQLLAIPFQGVDEIVLVHAVGKFALDNPKSQRFDPAVWKSNVDTFQNIARPLLSRVRQLSGRKPRVTFCTFGSVSDRYNIAAWRSYTAAKNRLRRDIQKLAAQGRPSNPVRGVFINVSTVATGNEKQLRPFANKAYWLTPEEIVLRSIQAIENPKPWMELDVIKPRPGFDEKYYRDPMRMSRKWVDEIVGRPPQVAKRIALLVITSAVLLGVSGDFATKAALNQVTKQQMAELDKAMEKYARENPEKVRRAYGSGGRERNPELRKKLEQARDPGEKWAKPLRQLRSSGNWLYPTAGGIAALGLGYGAYRLRKSRIERQFKRKQPSSRRR